MALFFSDINYNDLSQRKQLYFSETCGVQLVTQNTRSVQKGRVVPRHYKNLRLSMTYIGLEESIMHCSKRTLENKILILFCRISSLCAARSRLDK